MKTLQTLIGIVVVVALLYVAFIVGALVVRIMMGLLAILVVAWMIRSFIGRPGRRSP